MNIAITASDVTETAVAGLPDLIKGETVAIFYTGKDDDKTRENTMGAVVNSLVKSLTPKYVLWMLQLPKTRNGKIMRRVI